MGHFALDRIANDWLISWFFISEICSNDNRFELRKKFETFFLKSVCTHTHTHTRHTSAGFFNRLSSHLILCNIFTFTFFFFFLTFFLSWNVQKCVTFGWWPDVLFALIYPVWAALSKVKGPMRERIIESKLVKAPGFLINRTKCTENQVCVKMQFWVIRESKEFYFKRGCVRESNVLGYCGCEMFV